MGSPSLRSDVGPLFALAMGRDCGHLLVYTTALHVLSSSTKTTCSAICSLARSFVLSFAGGADIPCCIWCTRTYVVLYVWLDFGHAWSCAVAYLLYVPLSSARSSPDLP